MLRERTTVEQLDGCAGVHNGQEAEVAHARHVQHVDYDKMVDGIQRKVAATRQAHAAGTIRAACINSQPCDRDIQRQIASILPSGHC